LAKKIAKHARNALAKKNGKHARNALAKKNGKHARNALKKKFDFSCINFAIGYYDYHTKNEYVVIEDVYNGIKTGKRMIETLGNNYYPFIKENNTILG
jgi:acetylornithine deacetylase/succinyl-diaminopimelate desuccinylase-like protein